MSIMDTIEIEYDEFLSRIYDDAPFFGRGRSREHDAFNKLYFDNLTNDGSRILEFGSNTGGLSIPLARRGYKLDCVDISPYMHAVLSEKLKDESEHVAANITQILADATTYEGPQPYHSVLMPESVFVALGNADLQMAILDSCRRNLAPGGRIYADFLQPFYKAIYYKAVTEHTRFRTASGEVYLLTVHMRNNEYTQVQDWNVIFTRMENGEKAEVTEVDVKHRYVHYSELQWMLRQSGFTVVDIDVNFAGGRGFGVIAERA